MLTRVQVLKLDSDLRKLAEVLKEESSLLMFGRGYNYATALEASLKVWAPPLPQRLHDSPSRTHPTSSPFPWLPHSECCDPVSLRVLGNAGQGGGADSQ